MKIGKEIKDLAILGAGILINEAPNIIEDANKRKEINLLNKNRSFIFAIILTIFVIKLEYINMFSNNILNSMINILFGLIVLTLIYLFLNEEKKIFKTNSSFFRFLIISLIILGIINSFYHIGYAIFNLFII